MKKTKAKQEENENYTSRTSRAIVRGYVGVKNFRGLKLVRIEGGFVLGNHSRGYTYFTGKKAALHARELAGTYRNVGRETEIYLGSDEALIEWKLNGRRNR